jgi:hypothetical protein
VRKKKKKYIFAKRWRWCWADAVYCGIRAFNRGHMFAKGVTRAAVKRRASSAAHPALSHALPASSSSNLAG